MDLRTLRAAAGCLLVTAAVACGKGSGSPDQSHSEAQVPGSVSYQEHVTAGEKPPPSDSLVNPLSGNRDAAQQGERLFGSMNCDGCHGGGALGFVGPNLVDGRWRYGGSEGAVYQSIFYGRPQGMPAYGGMLSSATIWQLVTYLKSQPIPQDVATEAWP